MRDWKDNRTHQLRRQIRTKVKATSDCSELLGTEDRSALDLCQAVVEKDVQKCRDLAPSHWDCPIDMAIKYKDNQYCSYLKGTNPLKSVSFL